MEVSILDNTNNNKYAEMLSDCNEAMFYHSIQYQNILKDIVACEPYYLVVHNRDTILGAFPCFLKENSRYGNILNSLPFFGSHGGVLIRSSIGIEERFKTNKLLLDSFNALAKEKHCILSTIITSPFDTNIAFYENHLHYRFSDRRIAPIIEFNSNITDVEHEILYNIIDPDLRRTIRRPIKHGISVEESRDFLPLYEMNRQAILSKGGVPQPFTYFQKIRDSLEEGFYELTYAKQGDIIIAGLLVFNFKNTINYSIPAHYAEYSGEQGISLLIYEGMKKALRNGTKYWNFGGTSANQTSLHKFKSRWGTTDYHYHYFVNQYSDIGHILNM
jgi:hypothetical protein